GAAAALHTLLPDDLEEGERALARFVHDETAIILLDEERQPEASFAARVPAELPGAGAELPRKIAERLDESLQRVDAVGRIDTFIRDAGDLHGTSVIAVRCRLRPTDQKDDALASKAIRPLRNDVEWLFRGRAAHGRSITDAARPFPREWCQVSALFLRV